MARIKHTSLSGKIGPLVVVDREGMPYVRSLPRKRSSPPTPGEQLNRHLFKLVRLWLRPLYPFARIGFKGFSARFEGINAAVSQIHREALQRDGYNSFVDPALVKLSHGDLELPASMEVSLEQQEAIFNWDKEIGRNKHPQDRVMLIAYNIEAETAVYKLHAAQRFEGTASLSLQAAPVGNYHLYAAFVAADGSRQSDSKYLGVGM